MNKVLVGISFLMIVGFMVVNFIFIFNIVFRTQDEKMNAYVTFKWLFAGSWVAIVSWFILGVIIFYVK